MNIKYNNKFDLDEILEETNKKRKGSQNIDDQKTQNRQAKNLEKYDNQKEQNAKLEWQGKEKKIVNNIDDKEDITIANKEERKFNVNIDYSKEDLLIDKALLEDEDVEDENDIIKNFFKKENRIQYNFEEDEREYEEDILLNQGQVFEILKNNKKYLIKKFLFGFFSLMLSIGAIIFSELYNIYEGINFFTIINLIALLIAIIGFSDVIMKGFKSLFIKKGSFESIISVACVVCAVQNTISIFSPQADVLNRVYTPSVILILIFNTLSKYQFHKMMKRNSRYISVVDKANLVSYTSLKNILDPDGYQITCLTKEATQNQRNNLCYSELSYGTQSKRSHIYLVLIFCIFIFAISFFKTGSLYVSITTFCCMLILSFPLSKDFCFKYIVNRFSKKLYKNDILLYKYSVLSKIDDCNNLIINNNELFNKDSFRLLKMKVFDYGKINDSIINIASLLQESKSLLSEMFLDIIRNKRNLIREVSYIEEDPDKGIKGLVNNQEIIFGTSDYLLDNSVVIPSKYVNLSKAITEDRSLKTLYVAIDGSLAAMFLIQITKVDECFKSLRQIVKNDLKITICLNDPFICAKDIQYIYEINDDYINDITPKDSSNINDHNMGIMYSGKFSGFITSIIKCLRIKQSFGLMFLLEWASLLISGGLIFVFCILNMMGSITYSVLMLVQLFWLSVIFLTSHIYN